jgi:hypothetical protein
MENQHLRIDEISMVGNELSEDDLRLAAGGMLVVDVKSYVDGQYVVDEIWIFD